MSLGKTNFLIDALLEKGAVKMERFRQSDTKLKKIGCFLTPSGIAERVRLTQAYLEKKKTEYAALRQEIATLESESLNREFRHATQREKSPSLASGSIPRWASLMYCAEELNALSFTV